MIIRSITICFNVFNITTVQEKEEEEEKKKYHININESTVDYFTLLKTINIKR